MGLQGKAGMANSVHVEMTVNAIRAQPGFSVVEDSRVLDNVIAITCNDPDGNEVFKAVMQGADIWAVKYTNTKHVDWDESQDSANADHGH